MGKEGVRLQVFPLRDHISISGVERLKHVSETLRWRIAQGEYVPVTLRYGVFRRASGRVENVVKPVHGFFETLVLAQASGHEQGHVEKNFPVVEAVRTAKIEVHVVLRQGPLYRRRVWSVGVSET